jgi:formylglycine-generating enzyme required for sulfatase activity
MGSPDSDKDAWIDEKPRHQVKVTKPFYLGKYPVMVGQYREFIDATRHKTETDTLDSSCRIGECV